MKKSNSGKAQTDYNIAVETRKLKPTVKLKESIQKRGIEMAERLPNIYRSIMNRNKIYKAKPGINILRLMKFLYTKAKQAF
jgi:hypothetical protein